MDLAAWDRPSTDVTRLRRLALGYVTGAAVMGGTLTFVGMTAAGAYGLDEDEVVDAALVTTPEEDPKLEVEAAPEPEKVEARPRPKVAPLVAPTAIDDKLVEKTPVKSDNPFASDDPYAEIGADADGALPAAAAKPAELPKVIEKPRVVVAAPKKAEGPVRLTEDMTPPKALVKTTPIYPAEAKAAGIEGTVVVKFTVTETGEVTGVTVLRGPPELRASCEAAVKTWKFSPALDKDGRPVAVPKLVSFPFRIKT